MNPSQNSDANENILIREKRNHTNLHSKNKHMKETYACIVNKQSHAKTNHMTKTADGKNPHYMKNNTKRYENQSKASN